MRGGGGEKKPLPNIKPEITKTELLSMQVIDFIS